MSVWCFKNHSNHPIIGQINFIPTNVKYVFVNNNFLAIFPLQVDNFPISLHTFLYFNA